MSESYPILIHGEKKGALTVTREGLTTRFDARCEDPGTLVRLSVYGAGREGYLGVMTPENGALTLHRKLTRAGMADFPAAIEYAGEAGQKSATPTEREKRPEAAPGKKTDIAPPAAGNAAPQNAPGKPRERGTDILWHDAGDGSLYTVYKNQAYRAIPMAAWGLPTERMVEKRTIEGVEYAVFALRDGRIV